MLGLVTFIPKEFVPDILEHLCSHNRVPIIDICLGNNEVDDTCQSAYSCSIAKVLLKPYLSVEFGREKVSICKVE
jgi:hypothetical protein